MLHYWDTGINWLDIGVENNVNWLIDVSKEMIPGLKAIAARHIEDNVPVIIEGDFIHPELAVSFNDPKVKAVFIHESDKNQILQNYLAREGGELQDYRTDISVKYGSWLLDACKRLEIYVIESRPWSTAVDRIFEGIEGHKWKDA